MKLITVAMVGQSMVLKAVAPKTRTVQTQSHLYNLLEKEIVPLFYDRDRKGIPHRWIKMAKEAIKTINPVFNACRMMSEYVEQMYLPAVSSGSEKSGFNSKQENNVNVKKN